MLISNNFSPHPDAMKNQKFFRNIQTDSVMDTVSLREIQSEITKLKNKLTPKIINYLAILSVLSFPISLYRTVETEWFELTTLLHYSVFFLAGVLFLSRHHVDHKVVIYYLVYSGLIFSSTEFLAFGFMGIGELSAAFTVMVSFFYLDKRITILVTIIASSFYFISMNNFVIQQQALPVPAADFLKSPVNWLAIYFNAAVFFFFIGICTECVHKKMINLGKALREKSIKIEEQNKRIEYLANHDQLTGLPSHRIVGDKLQQAMDAAKQNGHRSALLFLDLDGFKAVNDTHGHEAGDVLLKKIASRIKHTVSDGDNACRIGGDEFLIIISQITNEDCLKKICTDLIDSIAKPVHFKDTSLTVGASIGAAVYPTCANNAKDLRAKADELMYQVKRSGKNNYRIARIATSSQPQLICS